MLWELSSDARVRKCNRVRIAEEVTVKLSEMDGGRRVAGLEGLMRCGKAWLCPDCSLKVAKRRAAQLAQLLIGNEERGGTTALATFTIQHHKGHTLGEMWNEAFIAAWAAMTKGRPWSRLKKQLGMDGYVRCMEVTYTETNGWHVHSHVLMIFDRPVSQETIQIFADELYELWARALDKFGYNVRKILAVGADGTERRGVDVRLADPRTHMERLGKYLTKLVYEAAGSRFKKAREDGQGRKGRTPFQLLDDVVNVGLADDLDLWHEYERVTYRKRQIQPSRGLYDRFKITDKTDEEIAQETLNGDALAALPPRVWELLKPIFHELLEATEGGGLEGMVQWLEDNGMEYRLLPAGLQSRASRDPGAGGAELRDARTTIGLSVPEIDA